MQWPTTSGVEAWIGTRHIAVIYWPTTNQMDVVPMETLPHCSICPSFAKDTGEELHSEGRRIGFHQEEEKPDDRGEVLILYQTEGMISLRQGENIR